MKINFSPPDITEVEIAQVVEALRSGWITTGPKTKELERKVAQRCGTARAACLSSATASMELTLRLLGIGPGDEVITCAYTYTASCSVICHTGATPVLVDCQKGGFHIDYDALEKAVTPRTKAIIPVDIAGIPCDHSRIREITESKKGMFTPNNRFGAAIGRVAVIADAAHSFGASRGGISTGSLSDFTCFSFHAVKNVTTAEGGAVTWITPNGITDDEIYTELMLLSLHGQSKDAFSKSKPGAWEYDIIYPAYKANMTDIAAGLGLGQVQRMDSLYQRRRDIIALYDRILSEDRYIKLQHFTEEYSSSGHLYLLRLSGVSEERRNDIISEMAEKGIATNVHYKPLPMHTAYKKLGFCIEDFPHAFAQYENEITLPLHTLLTDEEVHYIGETLRQIF